MTAGVCPRMACAALVLIVLLHVGSPAVLFRESPAGNKRENSLTKPFEG